MSSRCCAIVQEGPRKELGCLFPAEEDRYCGRHKRNKEYDLILSSGRKPCRYFFRGCNSVLTDVTLKTCSSCLEKKTHHKTNCSHEGCRYKAVEETLYCGKHQRNFYKEKEQQLNIRYCDIARGCFNVCAEGRLFCIDCLAIMREKDNKRYAERKELHESLTDEHNSLCCYCGIEFKTWITRFGKPVKSCEKCYKNQENADRKRDERERNYKAERFNNVESLYKQYVRSAGINSRVFELTIEQVRDLITRPCNYCDIHIEGEAIGIDRVNSAEGYTLENVVPACWNCNRMKSNFSKEFFQLHCLAIALGKWDSEYMSEWKTLYITRYYDYKIYKKSCGDKRGLEWSITEESYNGIKQEPCYLCGYNEGPVGIDRFDSAKGYTPDNVRPCCIICNRMKSDMSYDAFMEHIGQIVLHNTNSA